MSLTVSAQLIAATTALPLKSLRDYAAALKVDRELEVNSAIADIETLKDLIAAAGSVGDNKTARAVESILRAREGKFDKAIPNFKAFKAVLEAYLRADLIDGWIYVSGQDGKLYPELVTAVTYDDGNHYGRGKSTPTVLIETTSYGFSRDGNYRERFGVYEASHGFTPQAVANRRVADILAGEGIFKETAKLKEAHECSMRRHYEVTQPAFAKQFRVTGGVHHFDEDNYRRRGTELLNRRVIHDLESSDYGPARRHADSFLYDGDKAAAGVGPVPEHPVVKVFDLSTHETLWVHADNMTPYVYDKSLRSKLILPESHRDLLDVLTADLGAFTQDLIDGKSAGNVILCKGIPGVGKTLTAEVYAELIERPLYSFHSGALGTSAEDVAKNLREIFQRGRRWGCVLLLDEADVFVVQRGNNIEQNAIVAEFLRTLEYFDGLLFMTTNRPNDIDDAIISRCAAIIDYSPPSRADAGLVWKVMADQQKAPLAPGLIDELLELFPDIVPRDTKMLLRLALRVSAARAEPLSLDMFRRCAMFRAIKMKTPKPAAA